MCTMSNMSMIRMGIPPKTGKFWKGWRLNYGSRSCTKGKLFWQVFPKILNKSTRIYCKIQKLHTGKLNWKFSSFRDTVTNRA